MTKREAEEYNFMMDRIRALGISREDAEALRRISMTLRRWFERECGDGNGCIERDETTDKPYWLSTFNGEPGTGRRRYPIPDKETGARKRLAAIMAKHPNLTAYVQGDPRGCALYILTAEQIGETVTIDGKPFPRQRAIDSIYTRGVAIA